jgi:hypothetical protein
MSKKKSPPCAALTPDTHRLLSAMLKKWKAAPHLGRFPVKADDLIVAGLGLLDAHILWERANNSDVTLASGQTERALAAVMHGRAKAAAIPTGEAI